MHTCKWASGEPLHQWRRLSLLINPRCVLTQFRSLTSIRSWTPSRRSLVPGCTLMSNGHCLWVLSCQLWDDNVHFCNTELFWQPFQVQGLFFRANKKIRWSGQWAEGNDGSVWLCSVTAALCHTFQEACVQLVGFYTSWIPLGKKELQTDRQSMEFFFCWICAYPNPFRHVCCPKLPIKVYF